MLDVVKSINYFDRNPDVRRGQEYKLFWFIFFTSQKRSLIPGLAYTEGSTLHCKKFIVREILLLLCKKIAIAFFP